MSEPGHNSGVAAQQLRAFVERIERIEEEIKSLNGDKSEIYKEAKGNGFDAPTIRKIVAMRKLDPSERQEADALLDAYMAALGMLPEEQSSRVHVHVREEKIEKIRPETADVVAPETGAAVAGGSGQPEMIPANADGRNVEATVEQRPSATEFMNEPAAATETAGDYLREPAAVVSGQIIREGDAPQGTDHANGDAPRPDTDFQPPAFLSREAKPFRPNCLNPGDNCAGQGNQHCYSCRKAMAEADAVPA